jgi:UDP-N-acetylmuramate dehydrogenase
MPVGAAYDRIRAGIVGKLRKNEPLARHTSFRIGGPAALYVECDTVADLAHTLTVLTEEDVEYTVLGKGTNVLVSDEGYPGAVIVLGCEFKRHSLENGELCSGAAVVLAALVQEAFREGLTGLEFAVGIPGTLGGALAMNAGSRDQWIGSVVERVTLFVPGEGLQSLRGSEVAWRYRRNDLPQRGVIVEAALRLREGDAAQIRREMEASLRRRKRTQPLSIPNAGSVFVNPEGDSAGRLIEACGLKGARVGGAQVSEVHANFIVNTGGATAGDVVELVRTIVSAVEEEHGIELRPEIRFLGSFDA